MAKWEEVSLEYMSRNMLGIDWIVDPVIVVRSPDWLLIQRPGHNYWSAVARQHAYTPLRLTLVDRDQNSHERWIDVAEGRLTPKRLGLPSVRNMITPRLGWEAWRALPRLLREKTTLLLEGGGPRMEPGRETPGYEEACAAWRAMRKKGLFGTGN